MPVPTPTWQVCPVFGTYRNLDGTPKQGEIRFTLRERVVDNTSNVIFPGGGVLVGALGAETGSFSLDFPCSDDPDIFPAGWQVMVKEVLTDGSGREFPIEPTLAAVAGPDAGINLRKIVVPNDAPHVEAALLKGVPGGVAALNSLGQVTDASGTVVTVAGLASASFVASAVADERAVVESTTPTVVAFKPSQSQASIQARMDTAPAGARLFFAPGTYALSGSGLGVKADSQHVDALGATFTQATWATPVFDLLGRSGVVVDIGMAEFIGTRAGAGSAARGSSGYLFGAGVWANRDRVFVRHLRTKNMAAGVVFSSYDGTGTYDRTGQSNRIGVLECEGANFGALWVSQRDLVIDDIYVHDDIDDSSGTNPTHAYYCSATETFRATGITIKKARAENILSGQAFQLKYADGASLTNHTATNCKGLVNILHCNDLMWNGMNGTAMLANGGQGSVTIQPGASRNIADGAITSGSATLTSAGATCTSAEVGRYLTGAGIASGARIASVESVTSLTMSKTATATSTGLAVNISGPISARPTLTATSVTMAAGVDERVVAIWADDASINGLNVYANRPAGGNAGDYECVFRGDRGRVDGLSVKQFGLTASYAAATGFGSNVSAGWRFINPLTDGTRNVMHVAAGSSDVVISHNPALQRNQSGALAWVGVAGTAVGGEFTEFVPPVRSVANGYAALDGTAKVPLAQIPDLSILYAAPTMYALSTFGVNAAADMLISGSTSVAAANQALQVKFRPVRSMTLASMRWFSTTLGTGSLYDIGLYEDATGTKLWTKGATAWPALGTVVETGCAGVMLDPAKWYRVAFASDSAGTVGQFAGVAAASADRGILADGRFTVTAVSAAMPLPTTTLVAGSSGTGRIPLVRFHEA